MGYGQIVGGMKQTEAAKRKGSSSRVMSMYQAERDAITEKAEVGEAIGHSLVSLKKGYDTGQTQWENLEAGASELGLEEQIADKRAEAGRWEKWTGPSEKTLDEIVKGDVSGHKQLEISAGELKTMGEIKRTSGSKYLKTMDPRTGEYKDVKDSGWGEIKDVAQHDSEPYEATREKDYVNFPIAKALKTPIKSTGSLIDKTGESLGNIQGSLTEWWDKASDRRNKMNVGDPKYDPKMNPSWEQAPEPEVKKVEQTLTESEVNQKQINAEAFKDAEKRKKEADQKIIDASKDSDYTGQTNEQIEESYIQKQLGNPAAAEHMKKTTLAINENASSDVITTGTGSITETGTDAKQTRGQAFRAARIRGDEVFDFEGKSYNTNLAPEPEPITDDEFQNFNQIKYPGV